MFLGRKLTNNTGATITSLTVAFVGEQWRNGGATSPAVSVLRHSTSSTKSPTLAISPAINTPATGWPITMPWISRARRSEQPPAALDGNAAANRSARSAVLSVTVANGQEIWLRWRDVDHAGNDHGLAIDDLVITASGVAVDPAPTVTGTTPGTMSPASHPPPTSSSTSARACCRSRCLRDRLWRAAVIYAQRLARQCTALNPDSDLPYSAACTVTVTASQVTDADSNDPDDQMAADYSFSFTTADPPLPGATNVIINEVDADTPGNDTAEFVELFDGGSGNTPLNGLVVVFFAGNANGHAQRPQVVCGVRSRRLSRRMRTATSRSATRQSPAWT